MLNKFAVGVEKYIQFNYFKSNMFLYSFYPLSESLRNQIFCFLSHYM